MRLALKELMKQMNIYAKKILILLKFLIIN